MHRIDEIRFGAHCAIIHISAISRYATLCFMNFGLLNTSIYVNLCKY